ncbi:MAG TPA: GH25 family lysozyme [Vitreimonas sp.]|uniref:glycoside hydrolase family 25 protein n=1 Tax=Vitreimonas sp. TaxID=3069702 RepID=UPI002D234E20|nr:GH25 family lysozyme [Vitreimonas sp.]HYD89231.1 GH25 family lysozyme [Vitreimonas sp.]
MKRIALIAGALAVLAALVAMLGGWWTPWASRYIQGVDVSWHQGPIDWRALAADDVAFAYIKASEGADHVDPRFAVNWREADAAGLRRGAYHFFTLCQPGARQAANFIAAVPRADGALPPALDLEHMGPCRRGPTMPDVIAEARIFLDRVEAHYGVRPIIYTTREFHDAHLTALTGERFWLRSLGVEPRFRQRDWIIWQHHNRGHKDGVNGPIDLNAFRGDAAALAAFASGATS